jgi:hypothetical protein
MSSVYYKNMQDEVIRLSHRIEADEEFLIPIEEKIDWANDTEVLHDITNQNALIGDGTQFFTDIAKQLDHLRGITKVDLENVASSVVFKEEQVGFVNCTGYNVFRKGYKFTVAASDTTEHDASYTANMMLQGLGFKCDSNVAYGDYVEVELVDKDGIFYPAGSVLAKFAENIYVWANREFSVLCADAKTIPAGIYIRFRYVSVGTTDTNLIIEHYLRTTP